MVEMENVVAGGANIGWRILLVKEAMKWEIAYA